MKPTILLLFLALVSTAPADLIVHYAFQGDTGNTATDSATTDGQQDATITGGAFTTDPVRGDVLSMTGTGSNGAFGSLSVTSTTGSYTFAIWYKGTDALGYLYDQSGTRLIASLGSATEQDPNDGSAGPGLGGFDNVGWKNSAANNTTWTTGEWGHIAWVFENDGLGAGTDSMSVYLNGVAQNVFGPTGVPGDGTKRAIANIPNMGGTQRLFARAAAGGSGDSNQLTGLMDDVRIYDRALSASEIAALAVPTIAAGPRITSFTSVGGNLWELTLAGEANTGYEFYSSTTLDFTPGTLVENLTQADPVNDPGNVGGVNDSQVVTDGNGDAKVRLELTGEKNFVRGQGAAALFSENFDAAAALPAGWTSNGPVNGTIWEVGTPSGVPSGPSAAHSTPNCAGTNIGGYYTANTDVSLVTPAIAIPADNAATLVFRQFIDTDLLGSPHDLGSVRILDADNSDAPIAGLEILGIEGAGSAGWTQTTLNLPAAAVAGKHIKAEFRFVSNAGNTPDNEVWSGFYIDGVVLTRSDP